MKIIKIFISSSCELEKEREVLADVAMNLNYKFEKEGISIVLVKWEYVDPSSTDSRKQDEYNQKLKECERCIVMFWKKVGKYTKEELNEAYLAQNEGLNPKKINILFKFEDESELNDYKDVQKIYEDEYKSRDRFPERFYNIDSLKAKFLEYFIESIKPYIGDREFVTIENGQAKIDGKVYVELSQLHCFSKNDDFARLERDIRKTERLLSVTDPDDPDYLEYARDLNDLRKKKADMEKSIWNTSLELARMANERCSDRLRRAIAMLENGDNKGAEALLNEEEIAHDVKANQEKIDIGKAGQEGLRININEYKAKINAIRNRMEDGWLDKVIKLYDDIIKAARGYVEDEFFADLLHEYALFLYNQKQYHLIQDKYCEALSIYRRAILNKTL